MKYSESKKKPSLKPHGFIASLVKDVNKPPKLRIISGYLGKVAKADSTRIYLDAELRRFVDIPNPALAPTPPSSVGRVLLLF